MVSPGGEVMVTGREMPGPPTESPSTSVSLSLTNKHKS